MKDIAEELSRAITQYHQLLKKLPGTLLELRPAPGKWSGKEVLGHLIDSAQNNIRRFIVAHYEKDPHIVYRQDNWVERNNYQAWDSKEIIDLWYLLNRQICYILNNTGKNEEVNSCLTSELHSVEWLAMDYIKHLRHHIHPLLEMEPVPYP
jgi:hypothetical protein